MSTRTTRPTPDGRVAHTRAAVLAAGRELVAELGVRGVTVEAIAKRTGIAKTTIYRQWPSRERLVVAIIAETAFELPTPHTGDPLRDIRTMLVATWKALAEPARRSAFASMIESSTANHDLADLHRTFLDARIDPLDAAIARAVDRGLVESHMDVGLMRELLVAPVVVRAFIRAEPVDRDHIDRLMQQVLTRRRYR